ncbi:MAG: flavin reductase family protein [Clostridia bacterium]|nr:flavin reductase family protein [Clostridia bacterium]
MARKDLKAGTLLGPLPAVMVTVGNAEESNVLTVAWCGILSTDPARAYISVRPSRHSHKMLMENGEFVINLTTESLVKATDYVGIFTGAKVNKFEKCNLTRVPSKCVAPPTIAESPLALECRVFQRIESGTHDVFLADILSTSCDESIMDEDGRLRLDKAGLISYAHGEYFALGKKVGKFGFSATKKKKTNKRQVRNGR